MEYFLSEFFSLYVASCAIAASASHIVILVLYFAGYYNDDDDRGFALLSALILAV